MRKRMSLPLGLLLVALAGVSPATDAPPSVPPVPADSVTEAVIARQSAEFAQLFPLILENARLARQLSGGPLPGDGLESAASAPRAPAHATSRAAELLATQSALRKALHESLQKPLSPPATVAACSTQIRSAIRSSFAALHQAESDAQSALAQINRLAGHSRLYAPEAGAAPDRIFALGSAAATKDYLSRQLSRVAVLCDYATPYLNCLDNMSTPTAAQDAAALLPLYWKNTLAELNRVLRAQDRDGAVGRLEALFLGVLADLTAENGAARLAELPADDETPGHDLFSAAHRDLLRVARSRGGPAR